MFDPYNIGQQLDIKFSAEREHPSSSQQLQINKMTKRPQLKIDQIANIRPFSNHLIAKRIEKSWFFNDFLQRKPIRSHTTSQFFCLKSVALICMLLHLSFKNRVQFVWKGVIWALKAKKWPCPSLPFNAQIYSEEIRYRPFIWHTVFICRTTPKKGTLFGLQHNVQCDVK